MFFTWFQFSQFSCVCKNIHQVVDHTTYTYMPSVNERQTDKDEERRKDKQTEIRNRLRENKRPVQIPDTQFMLATSVCAWCKYCHLPTSAEYARNQKSWKGDASSCQ